MVLVEPLEHDLAPEADIESKLLKLFELESFQDDNPRLSSQVDELIDVDDDTIEWLSSSVDTRL